MLILFSGNNCVTSLTTLYLFFSVKGARFHHPKFWSPELPGADDFVFQAVFGGFSSPYVF